MAQQFELEYVTSAVSLRDRDGIIVHIVNDGAANEDAQVFIFRALVPGLRLLLIAESLLFRRTLLRASRLLPLRLVSIGFVLRRLLRIYSKGVIRATAELGLCSHSYISAGRFCNFRITNRERIW
jgi:hypothetical protein